MKQLLAISTTTLYHFSIDEIAFLSGSTKGEIKHLFSESKSKDHSVLGLDRLFSIKTGNERYFTQLIEQANMRLWQHLESIKVDRRLTSKGYKYPHLHKGAISLINTFSSANQKVDVTNIMERSKFNPSWGRNIREVWLSNLKTSIGMLAL